MSKLDKIKESLNTLRVLMSLLFGMFVVLVSGLIKRFDSQMVDLMFWLGVIVVVLILIIITGLIIKIVKRTNEIEGL